MAKPTLIVAGESFSSDVRAPRRPEAQPLDFRSVANVARETAALGEQIQQMDNAQAMADAQQQASEEMALLQRELRDQGGAANAQTAFIERSKEIEERIRGGLSGQRQQDRFGTFWDNLYSGHRLRVADQAFSKGIAVSRDLMRRTASRLADSAAEEQDPRMFDHWISGIDNTIDGMVEDGVITREDAAVERDSYRRRAAQKAAENLIATNPAKARAALDGGDIRLSALDDEDRAAFKEEAKDATIRAEAERVNASQAAIVDMKDRVRSDIDSMRNTGVAQNSEEDPLDYGSVRTVLGKEAADAWRREKRVARDDFYTGQALSRMPADALEAYVSKHQPAGNVEYIEDNNGSVVRVDADGSETMLIPPSGVPSNPPADTAEHSRLMKEYEEFKSSKSKADNSGPQYIESENGSVLQVDADGSETMLIPPHGVPSTPPKDPAEHKRLIDGYEKYKKSLAPNDQRGAALAAKAEGILKQRSNDPVQATIEAFGGSAIDFDGSADELSATIAKRQRDQERLGIEGPAQRVLSNSEATELSSRMSQTLETVNGGINVFMKELDKKFGRAAEAAFRDVLLLTSGDQDMSRIGASVGRKIGLGITPSVAEANTMATVKESGDAARAYVAASEPRDPPAWTPGEVVPNLKQIQMLVSKPDLAPQFEQKFGAGSATFYLKQKPVSFADEPLSDGTHVRQ